ncbi:MAG: 50S ribosomal protein L22 [bacterium]
MEVKAVMKYVRLSPRKARDMARAIQGLAVADAIRKVEFSERKAARQLEKTIRSAVANAENNAKLSADDLKVKEATIGDGPAMKRFWARSRGMVSKIRKRTSHVTIVLSDGK